MEWLPAAKRGLITVTVQDATPLVIAALEQIVVLGVMDTSTKFTVPVGAGVVEPENVTVREREEPSLAFWPGNTLGEVTTKLALALAIVTGRALEVRLAKLP